MPNQNKIPLNKTKQSNKDIVLNLDQQSSLLLTKSETLETDIDLFNLLIDKAIQSSHQIPNQDKSLV